MTAFINIIERPTEAAPAVMVAVRPEMPAVEDTYFS